MTKYLIHFGAHSMDDIPEDEMSAVGSAARAVVQEIIDAGVYVVAGGLMEEPATIVSTDGTVTSGSPPDAISGLTIVDVPSRDDVIKWATKIAAACRCDQEVREIGFDAELEEMVRRAGGSR